jgi:hypothetical protein
MGIGFAAEEVEVGYRGFVASEDLLWRHAAVQCARGQ